MKDEMLISCLILCCQTQMAFGGTCVFKQQHIDHCLPVADGQMQLCANLF